MRDRWDPARHELYGFPEEDRGGPRRRSRAARRSAHRDLLISTAFLAIMVSSIAVAQGGDGPSAGAARGEGSAIVLGERNPGSGGSTSETAIVANAGDGGLVLRPSNTAKGGRAISATCDNDGLTEEDGCAVYVNKGQGAAATFRTQGSVPFALRETNNGRVEHLNADLLDGLHAADFLGVNAKAADANTLDGQDSSAFLGVNGKAADANTLDGQDSSEFLGVNGKAADANTLDGEDSSAFLGVNDQAADANTLDGRDSRDFARFAGLVNTAGGVTTGPPGVTGEKLGTGNYLVKFPAGTVPFDGTDCTTLIPLAVIAGAAARFVGVERSSCDDSNGAAEFEVNTFSSAAAAVDSQFWFIAY